MQVKTISLPRLDGLSPTLESTMLKLCEETGELAQAIGKHRGMSGENISTSTDGRIALELLDVAQTAITMMFVLEDQGVDLGAAQAEHLKKLTKKGYLTDDVKEWTRWI